MKAELMRENTEKMGMMFKDLERERRESNKQSFITKANAIGTQLN